MELFYSRDIDGTTVRLDEEESGHCVRVLRHRVGDSICVMDGEGAMLECILTDDSSKAAIASVRTVREGFGAHPYKLTMAVCPTKNIDRFEWFVEKSVEMGVDRIVPVIGEHSERKVVKRERLDRIVLSAAKQSLKALVPAVDEPVSVRDFIAAVPEDTLKLICCCFDGEAPRRSVKEVLGQCKSGASIAVLIGPEGDFSEGEVTSAMNEGWIPVHLGDSRLRTETAALVAVAAVYGQFMD